MLPPLAAEDHWCAECNIDYTKIEIDDALTIIKAVPELARANVELVSGRILQLRPDDSWSMLEYLCHIRDVYATFTIRLYRAQHEDRPAVEPMLNDLRAHRFAYNDLEANSVLEELEHNVDGFAYQVDRVKDWNRTVSRLPEEIRTSRWLVRQAMHEGVHHLADMTWVREQVEVVTKG
ncbi:DinB family protein [Antrihabitans cavernicola]|uniref:DinB family protein n=1 Tax=Antrihabitans cavernicola TaxID=2495913 RepID=A0A5A7SHY1_9NOCA|nr:DinB family protein [Spelaeibacter cavernicola]